MHLHSFVDTREFAHKVWNLLVTQGAVWEFPQKTNKVDSRLSFHSLIEQKMGLFPTSGAQHRSLPWLTIHLTSDSNNIGHNVVYRACQSFHFSAWKIHFCVRVKRSPALGLVTGLVHVGEVIIGQLERLRSKRLVRSLK
jgi:hypothetical protein